jgi:putative addiction module component (TIGR02574 family)
MTKSAQEIFERAKTLDFDERADLVERLADTLEPSTDPQYLAAWEAEIRARIEAFERGESKGIPWREAIEQIERGENDGE